MRDQLTTDVDLTEAQRDLRARTRRFVEAEVMPHRRAWDRREQVDRGLVAKLGEMGFLGLMIPEEHGGTPVDTLSYTLVMEELGRGDASVRGIVSVSLGLVAKTIAAHGSPEQKQRWLSDLCAGRAIGCFALTEPAVGYDAGNLRTTARRAGSGWVIDGTKMFITNGTWADVILLFARTGEREITAFFIPASTPGVAVREIKGKLGLRGQATAELSFDDVRVGDDALVGAPGRGLGIALAALTRGRVSIAAGAVGLAQGALEAAVEYSQHRVQFGVPIASFQLVQELLADSAVDVIASRALVHRVARLADAGLTPKEYATDASIAKYYASEAAVRVSNNCLQVFGGYGFIDEFPAEKYVRDARVLTLYEGTSQVQKLIIGRHVTGESAFV
jgi:alkylation response protein AidB-like acyl-CoA dehydrogenase